MRGDRVVGPGWGCAVQTPPVTAWQHKAGKPSASHPSFPTCCSSAGAAPASPASNLLVQSPSLPSPALLLSDLVGWQILLVQSGLSAPRPDHAPQCGWGPPRFGYLLTKDTEQNTLLAVLHAQEPTLHQLLWSKLQTSLAASLEANALFGKKLLEHANEFFVSITLKFIIR